MNTRNESASSQTAKRHATLREWLIAVANALVVAAGICSAYSLAVSRYESMGSEMPTRVALYKADAAAGDARACLQSLAGTPAQPVNRVALSPIRSD
ncbi:hypothetical protein VAR608DRAFT_2857 [Variovorax sp. HW608]|uniref:hypothetical protein n=1 Tax=Variovorax sp. HW608 TaxID=1034889 RepID=UPI00081FAA82|nr:hypothetical protein [Variovorax sp. HW608]SCK32611.1 hypothetical protein VAR608DRAFT_2857 [Variovorax sp. HW608]